MDNFKEEAQKPVSERLSLVVNPDLKGSPLAPLIRDTFGVVDGKTGELYPDLIRYYILTVPVSKDFLYALSISRDNKVYLIQKDSVLRRALRELPGGKTMMVIISMQQRTTGNFAMARIYK